MSHRLLHSNVVQGQHSVPSRLKGPVSASLHTPLRRLRTCVHLPAKVEPHTRLESLKRFPLVNRKQSLSELRGICWASCSFCRNHSISFDKLFQFSLSPIAYSLVIGYCRWLTGEDSKSTAKAVVSCAIIACNYCRRGAGGG